MRSGGSDKGRANKYHHSISQTGISVVSQIGSLLTLNATGSLTNSQPVTFQFTQVGSAVTAVVTSTVTGVFTNYSGTAGATSIALNGTYRAQPQGSVSPSFATFVTVPLTVGSTVNVIGGKDPPVVSSCW